MRRFTSDFLLIGSLVGLLLLLPGYCGRVGFLYTYLHASPGQPALPRTIDVRMEEGRVRIGLTRTYVAGPLMAPLGFRPLAQMWPLRVSFWRAVWEFDAHPLLLTSGRSTYLIAFPIWCIGFPFAVIPLLRLRAHRRKHESVRGFNVVGGLGTSDVTEMLQTSRPVAHRRAEGQIPPGRGWGVRLERRFSSKILLIASVLCLLVLLAGYWGRIGFQSANIIDARVEEGRVRIDLAIMQSPALLPQGFRPIVDLWPSRHDYRRAVWEFDFHTLSWRGRSSFLIAFPIWCAVLPLTGFLVMSVRARLRNRRLPAGFDVV